MNINEVVAALNRKDVSRPCPRCASKDFSVVGESEISVIRPPLPPGIGIGLPGIPPIGTPSSSTPLKTTMPIIIITCDNCGFISQHAKASLGLFSPATGIPRVPPIGGIGGTR